jgi:hypothetical protein
MRCALLLLLVVLLLGCASNHRHVSEESGAVPAPREPAALGNAIADMQARQWVATYGPPLSEDPADVDAWLRQIDYMRKAGR